MLKHKIIYLMSACIVLLFLMSCSPNEPNPPKCPSMPENYGIYSETIAGIKLDVNAFLGISFGGGGGFVPSADSGFVDDENDKMEGLISKKSTIKVSSNGQWAVWFIQHGLTSSDDEIINMCDYEGGNLKFWIKAESNVRDLIVGIRSGNVRAGEETSKVRLKNYPAFAADNQWHEIAIPIAHFEGPEPKADISKIKVFFVIGSGSGDTGGTNGVASFWVDNVRWTK